MAIAFDAASTYEWPQNEAKNSVTWSHTCSGDNRAIVVTTGVYGSTGKVSGVTYNGTSLTNIWDASSGSGANSSGWILVAPATGAHDVVVTFASATAQWSGDQGCGAISFTGVHQTTPNGTAVTNSGFVSATSITATVTTASDETVVDGAYALNENITVGANQTRRCGTTTSGASTQSGADGGAMSWSIGGTSHLVVGAVSLKPAAGGGSSASAYYAYAQQ